ncbi:MAG: peptide chain release factor 1 [Clostridia bacterium]|nr:peptide chain release factor 1 [Clostridia bacterium]
MFDTLKRLEERYHQREEELADPAVLTDQSLFTRLMREHKAQTPIIEAYHAYCTAKTGRDEAEAMLDESDADLRALAQAEYDDCSARMETLTEQLKMLLLPRDPNDDKNVIVEIRAGAGGDEAALFASVLYRMYNMFAESSGFRSTLMSINETGLGGFKEVTFMLEGEGAYSKLKFESGVHRVQRVPETEASGRIHTSTVTVAVLPEAEEIEVEINPADLKIETIKSSGAGGQHVNKTESAIRLVHKPTGITIECQDERSQYKNKDKALKLLRTKLYDIKQSEQENAIASARRSQVGTGDRSERIRTYNYPQGRVTDHRIGLTIYALENFLNGNITEMIEALTTADIAAKLDAKKSNAGQ